jgi:hypothetical protein
MSILRGTEIANVSEYSDVSVRRTVMGRRNDQKIALALFRINL